MIRAFYRYGIAAITGIGAISLLCLFAHESPWHVVQILLNTSLGEPEDLSVTLFYATHLMFCATGLAVAFQAGLFPIGAEGQLSLACLTTTMVAIMLPPTYFSLVIVLVTGLLASTVLGLIVAYFKCKKGAHEVITSMMLNFIVAAFANYMVSHHFQSQSSQDPETAIIHSRFWLFPSIFHAEGSPANVTFFLAVLACIATWYFLEKTRPGFEIRAVGKNKSVAQNSGISVERIYVLALGISALLAGFGAWNQILGYAHKYQIGFSADYGFLAIAVALVARNNPLAIIPSSLFFAILLKGATGLDIETDFITRDFVKIIQAVLILMFLVLQKQRDKSRADAEARRT